ncbi:unnamed protein product, partial [Musa textilis]
KDSPPAHTLSPRDRPPHRATSGSPASPAGSSPIARANRGSSLPGERQHKSRIAGSRRSFPLTSRLGPDSSRCDLAPARSACSVTTPLERPVAASDPLEARVFSLLRGWVASTSRGVSLVLGLASAVECRGETVEDRPPWSDWRFIISAKTQMTVSTDDDP